jgi:pimeloyl-ACP methyl ester carboxylesterase
MTSSQHYVQANGLNIYYEVYGAGPPLILIHGGLGTGQDWQMQAETLAEQFQVFLPDSRGHGRTDNPAGSLSYHIMADDLVPISSKLLSRC